MDFTLNWQSIAVYLKLPVHCTYCISAFGHTLPFVDIYSGIIKKLVLMMALDNGTIVTVSNPDLFYGRPYHKWSFYTTFSFSERFAKVVHVYTITN